MPAKGDDDRLVLDGEHRRSWRPGTRRQIGRRGPILPLGDRLLVDPVPPGQHPQALLTMLYRSTDRRSRAGASVEYLAHSASFHSTEKIAPSKPGTKHLEWRSWLQRHFKPLCQMDISYQWRAKARQLACRCVLDDFWLVNLRSVPHSGTSIVTDCFSGVW